MYAQIEERSPKQRATNGVRQMIRARGWREGQRLPSEEALAGLFKVSRSTLRKALDDLTQQGLVVRERHRGCIVRRPAETDGSLINRAVVVINDLRVPAVGQTAERSSAGIRQGMLDAAEHLGRTALLLPIHGADTSLPQQLIEARPQGLVMLCWRAHSPEARQFSATLHQAGIPVVAFGMDEVPEAVANYDRVATDHESGTRQLLELLSSQGRKRVLRAWTPSAGCPWIAAHNRAYESTVPTLGLARLPALHVPEFASRAECDQAAFDAKTRHFAGYLAEHLRTPQAADAIMVATDSDTFHVAAACRLLGCRPGVDVLVTGYDNYWPIAFERRFESATPFATVDKRNGVIGAELIRLLDQRLADPSARPPQFCSVAQEVVETHTPQPSTAGDIA